MKTWSLIGMLTFTIASILFYSCGTTKHLDATDSVTVEIPDTTSNQIDARDLLIRSRIDSVERDGSPELQVGQVIYQHNCKACHGETGRASVAPPFKGISEERALRVITEGVPWKGMMSWEGTLNAREIKAVAAYVTLLGQ